MSARTIGDIESGVERRLRAITLELLLDALRVETVERESILAQHRGVATAIYRQAAQFPNNPHELIGRTRDVDRIVDLTRAAKVRLVTITGPPGVGKTSTAIAAARRMERHFSGNIVFVGLLAVDDPGRVEAIVLEHLGMANDSPLQIARASRVLVVVDNFEHLIPAAASFGALVSRLGFAQFVVTSREPLQIRAEHIVPIEALENACAAELFRACVLRTDPNANFSADEAPVIARICAKVDNLPLAIELAVPRMRFISLVALAAEVDAPLGVLAGGARDTDDRHRSMEAAIAASYALLDTDERDVFVTLGIFRTGATVRAAAACLGWTIDRTRSAIESVAQKSLVQLTVRADVQPWISLLQTVREFAKARGRESGEESERRRRYVDFYRTLADELRIDFHGAGYASARYLLRRERDNAHEAVKLAVEIDRPEVGLWIVLDALYLLAEEVGAQEQIELVETLLPLLHGGAARTGKVRAKSYLTLAALRYYIGDLDAAERASTKGLELARRYDPGRLVVYYDIQLIISGERGDYDGGKRVASALLALRRKLSDSRSLAVSLSNVAVLHMYAGELDAAGLVLDEMSTVLARIDECHNLDSMLEIAAQYYLRLGEGERAARLARRALAIAPSDQISVILRIEQTLGDIASAAGAYVTALDHFGRALDHAAGGWDYPSRYALCAIVVRCATALRKLGRSAEADRTDALAMELELFWSLRLRACDWPQAAESRKRPENGRSPVLPLRTKAELADAVRGLHSFVREVAHAPHAITDGAGLPDAQYSHFRQLRSLA